jgi:hypothetical protein
VKRTIFYSWQSDLPNNTNRSFIERALDMAAKVIRTDDSVSVEPVLDRDTSGVAGSPEIANTIFRKIASCAVFVADVSIINPTARKRRTPNPNVLIELGYALRALGPERVLMVMNSQFGGPEALPFDLKLRRVVTYSVGSADADRIDIRRGLGRNLEIHLRVILDELEQTDVVAPKLAASEILVSAIRASANDRELIARDYIGDFFDRVLAVAPSPPPTDDEALVEVLSQTTPLIAEFARVCNIVSAGNDGAVANIIFTGFSRILAQYDPPRGELTRFEDARFDYFRFLGHELFLCFVASLLHEKRLSLLKQLLAEDLELPMRDVRSERRSMRFHDLQEPMVLLWQRTKRLNLMSSQATLLYARHSEGELAVVAPFDWLMGADYFLFLCSESHNDDEQRVLWFPVTSVYLQLGATFLERLHRNEFAIQVATASGVPGSDEVRDLVRRTEPKIARAFGISWNGFKEARTPTLIGSR